MITDKEYFLLSILAYFNFEKKDIGKNLYELFTTVNDNRLHNNVFIISMEKNKKYFLDYFKEELKKWKTFYVDDRRFHSKTSSKTSYFSVCFKNLEDFFVIAYRGSEIFPLEDAYLDFIQTDLVFGVGFIPEQFNEGVETYEYILNNFNITREKISFTGHSLGGGIAQYVLANSYIKNNYIPSGKTFNSIGINRKNIFKDIDLDNNLFSKKIINYGHSEDFTNTIFKHFGKSIKVDKNSDIEEENEKSFFLDKIDIFNKRLYHHHHDDVFIPFFDKHGNFQDKINIEFIGSSIRKLLKKESLFENKFLAFYFSDKKIENSEQQIEYIKKSILKALNKNNSKLLYKEHIISYFENIDILEMKEFYKLLKNKMPSPYEAQDIFDLIVFEPKKYWDIKNNFKILNK